MKSVDSNQVYNRMLEAIDEIADSANNFHWESKDHYACWLAQSFFYVQWTTRQLALASALTKPMAEDRLHWRFIEEAKEEKKHELLALADLKSMGFSPEQFQELPHTSFFYQTLSYLILHEHPIAILGYALTLEGFAAKRLSEVYPKVVSKYGDKATSFLRLHCELDKDHFDNALPHLQECPAELLPLIMKGINQCCAIYKGILQDIDSAVSSQSALRPQTMAQPSPQVSPLN